MRVIRFFLKLALLPVILFVTLIQWFFIFLIGFSSVVFNVLAWLFLLAAVLSCLMGIADGREALEMIATGFVIFMVPVAGTWIVTHITALNMNMRDFIRS